MTSELEAADATEVLTDTGAEVIAVAEVAMTEVVDEATCVDDRWKGTCSQGSLSTVVLE